MRLAGLAVVAALSTLASGCAICVDFEPPVAAGSNWGSAAGTAPGTVILTTNGVAVSAESFAWTSGGGAFNKAQIDVAPPYAFASGQALRANNISVGFDYGSMGGVQEVTVKILDLGGFENLSVNGSSTHVGELSASPATLGGVSVSLATTPLSPPVSGKRGTLTLRGPVQRFLIGGQELWIDDICARK